MINMPDERRIELRRWALEQVIAAGYGNHEGPLGLVVAAQKIESYVMDGLVSAPDAEAPP